MKRNKYKILSSIFVLMAILSCNKADINGIVGNNKVPPGLVSNVQVVNENGQARITYTLPSNPDLLYIKAVYKLENGAEREIKASNYTNTLLVDGFSDTEVHEVRLYSVNKSEAVSEPVKVSVKPLTAPFKLVFEQLQATATFGGVRLKSLNKFKSSLVIVPMIDSLGNGDWANLDNVYTQDSVILFNIRGLKSNSSKFAFYVRDRWLNRSETLYTTLTPLEENLLDKDLFKEFKLPGDATIQYGEYRSLWDKDINPGKWPSFYTVESAGEPQTVSWDLGKQAKISRIVIYPRSENGFYEKGNLRNFEVWGSNTPNLDGSFESWNKVMTYNVVKPSGTGSGINTAADEAYGRGGWSFDFPEDAPKYQYLRIRNLRNWRGSYFMQINQISVWGVY